jgi:hypothetical protein
MVADNVPVDTAAVVLVVVAIVDAATVTEA